MATISIENSYDINKMVTNHIESSYRLYNRVTDKYPMEYDINLIATQKRYWQPKEQIFGHDDSYVTASSIEQYSRDIDLVTEGFEGTQVEVQADFQEDPHHDILVMVYLSLDGVAYDKQYYERKVLNCRVDTNQISITLKDIAHCRIGIRQNGIRDTGNKVRIYYRTWR